jgi:hypothetical protein
MSKDWINYKKGCTRLAAASDKVYQLLVQGRWFSLLLKVVLKHQKSKINQKIGYPNNLKVFGSMKIKGPKMVSEIVSPMYERGEAWLNFKKKQYIHTST